MTPAQARHTYRIATSGRDEDTDRWPGFGALVVLAVLGWTLVIGGYLCVQWIWSSLGRLVGGPQ